MQVLAGGQLINAAVGLSGSFLVVTRQEKLFASSMSLSALVCIVFMVIYIPSGGALAAAVIYTCCLMLLSTLQFYGVYKTFNQSCNKC